MTHCPTCNLNWSLNPPMKCDGSNHFRCIECKAVYSGEMLAASDMSAALKPFVKLADEYEDFVSPRIAPDEEELNNWTPIPIGDCRAARSAIAKATQ